MADYGLKISKSGQDVKTAANTDLIFSSSLSTFKDFMSGLISYTVPAYSVYTYEIAHGLTYAPSYIVFNDGGDGYWHYCNNGGLQFYVSPTYDQCYASANFLSLYIKLYNSTSSPAVRRAKYFIFKDKAS